ncbi:hypothetical protein HK105_200353 [Polyrhizophydium stewartii]|uniref:Reverse transcriptase zinc-binding domain-containing protein n=1 Tax=Polyrhizophydium stewartii TaxID=2732419 RepID=A0ABR4NLC9_9FUNG
MSPARATASYRDHQFAATAGFFRSPMFDASLSNGVRYLIAARCNAIWSTSRAVAARLLRNGHPFVGRQCPICRTPLGAFSPVGHLITACTDPRIQAYRDTIGFSREFFVLLWQHAHEVAGLLPAPDVNSLDLSILVLGGTLCGGATLGNDWLAGFSQMGTVVAPPAGRVVHFLQRTMWSYSSSLWAYHRNAAANSLATPLKALIAPRNIFFSRRLVWSRGSARLHRRFVGLTWFPDDWAARELLPRMHERRMLVSPARATASYRDHQFAATAGFFRSPMFDASLSNGVRYLIAARCNAIWSTSRAVAARLLRNGHPFVGRQCPICRTPLGAFSPVGHLITACTDPRIQAHRDTIGFSREFFVLLWQHAHEVAGLLPAPDVNSLDLSILVLGGTLCGGATLGNDWLAGFSQMGTVVAPPAGRVVHFLQRTMWSYSSSLWAYHRNAAVHALAPVLANRRFSVRMRHRVFVAVVLGIARYGIEVFAGMKTGLSRVQPAINKGVRMIFGVRPSTAVGPLLVESGVPLLSVLSHVATVRLLDRAVHKRTFVRLICSGDVNPVRRIVNGVPRVAGKMYWSRRAKKLHNDLTQAGVTLNDADTRSGFARVRTLAALTTNRASHRYQAAGFSLTSGFFTQPLFDQPRSRGTRLLAALRMDGLWTARTALRIPGLLVNHPFNLRDCILCNENIADVRTFAHLVIDCDSLAHIRRDAELGPFIVLARQCLGTQAALEDIYTWLLGGATPAGLRLNDWLVGRAGQLGDRAIRPLAARLADFLGAAYTLYQAQLWQYHRARHAAAQG